MTNDIRAALERLVEDTEYLAKGGEDLDRAWAAIATAHNALAEPVGEGPDHVNLIGFAFGREPWATWLRSGGCLESAHCELTDLMLAVLARWGHPAAPPAPEPGEVGEVAAAWLYLGEPDFDGTTWRENWRVTTDEKLAQFKAQPDCPVPLFRRPATLLQQPPAPAPVVVPVAECPHCGYEGEMARAPQTGEVPNV